MSDVPLTGVQQSPLRFINIFLESIQCRSYLELGLFIGETFIAASKVVPHCVGVDKVLHKGFEKHKPENVVHEMTTDEFFSKNTEKFDVIFIDADHSIGQVKKDFNNSLKAINKNGFIIIHDTDPACKKFTGPEFCYDVYKIVDYIMSLEDYSIITIPMSDAGLSIVSRKDNRRVLGF